MKSRDITITKEMNMDLFNSAIGKDVRCTLWIDPDEDRVLINFEPYIGGMLHYTSDHDGLLVFLEDDSKKSVCGIFLDGLLNNIDEDDKTEIELRKLRYIEGEK